MADPKASPDPLARIFAILDAHRIMSIGVVGEDGWPQVTQVNYFRRGLHLYFVVARSSRKLAAVSRDPRVGLALGGPTESGVHGLSIRARVHEVADPTEISDLNKLIWDQPQDMAFTPHPTDANAAMLVATPQVVRIIDEGADSKSCLFRVVQTWRLEPIGDPA